jgi:hypothetical protein
MKRRQLISLTLPVLFLTLTSTVLAGNTWSVDGVNGNDANDCQTALTACKSIGHAISLASSGDSIIVAATTYTENLIIGISLNVIGSGANTTIIDGGGHGRVVTIPNHSTVTLSDVTIRNGSRANLGGGIYNYYGLLTINNSTVSGNTAMTRFSGIPSYGGGIFNGTDGKLTVSNSTISGNTAACVFLGCYSGFFHGPYQIGGGIYNEGLVFISNSTLVGNAALGIAPYSQGGAIAGSGKVTVSNSTISGNTAAHGGGISGTVGLWNSIVANNSGGNCYGTVNSNGYNLSSDNTCNFNGPGDLNNTDPKLGTFGYNGGPTQKIPLLSGSPAIDAGNPGGCIDQQGRILTTDQRGMPRPDPGDTGGCDMGAYESQND